MVYVNILSMYFVTAIIHERFVVDLNVVINIFYICYKIHEQFFI